MKPDERRKSMQRKLYGLLAALSFAACLVSGVLVFLDYIEHETYRRMLAVASLAWFVFAAAWSGKTVSSRQSHSEPVSTGK